MEQMALKVMESPKVAAAVATGAMSTPALHLTNVINPVVTFVTAILGAILLVVLIWKHIQEGLLKRAERFHKEKHMEWESEDHDSRVLERKGKRGPTPQ